MSKMKYYIGVDMGRGRDWSAVSLCQVTNFDHQIEVEGVKQLIWNRPRRLAKSKDFKRPKPRTRKQRRRKWEVGRLPFNYLNRRWSIVGPL